MRLTNFFKIKIIAIVFILLGCNLKSNEKLVVKQDEKKEAEISTIDSLKVKDKEGVLYTIKYDKDSLHISQGSINIIKINYPNRFDKAFPVNGLIVNDKSAACFITSDHVLLLPLNEVNNRINLMAIDLRNKKEINFQFKERSDVITTAINSFYFNEKSNIIISTNSLNYEGKTTVHYYKMGKNLITHQGTKDLNLTPEMLESNDLFSRYLNENNNNIPQ